MTSGKLNWWRDGDQHVAASNGFEYRITEWCGAAGSNWLLRVKDIGASDGKTSSGGEYSSLKRAKEVAYSLHIRG